jgi:hypothetical protein
MLVLELIKQVKLFRFCFNNSTLRKSQAKIKHLDENDAEVVAEIRPQS